MAQTMPRWHYLALLLCLVCGLCASHNCDAKYKNLCSNCVSCLCPRHSFDVMDCRHQLFSSGNTSTCALRFVNEDERQNELILKPHTQVYRENERPFVLQAYQRRYGTTNRIAFNISFKLDSEDRIYQFRFRNLAYSKEDLGREFILKNLPSAFAGSVFWDCPFFNNFQNREIELTVLDDRGSGGVYSFFVPDTERTNPNKTSIRDWQLLLVLDLGLYYRAQKAVATVQLAPFKDITYRLELRYCQKEESCHNGTVVAYDQFHIKSLEEEELAHRSSTFDFQGVGSYRVTAKILHGSCPPEGCVLSKSAVLKINAPWWLSPLRLSCCLFIAVAVVLGILYLHKSRQHKKLLSGLSRSPVSVLLVYHAETEAQHTVIKTLSDFLTDACFAKTFLVDRDASLKNPNEWTVARMREADRVIFMVPSGRRLRSITPVQDQWRSALSYFEDSYIISHGTDRAAVILVPSVSSDIPSEISSLRRFHLLRDMTSFVTWVHGGTQVDRWLLWRSRVTSKRRITFKQLRASVHNISKEKMPLLPGSENHRDFGQKKIDGTSVHPLLHLSSEAESSKIGNNDDDDEDDDHNGDDLDDQDDDEGPGFEFDRDIPSVEDVILSAEEGRKDDTDSYCDGNSDLDDKFFI